MRELLIDWYITYDAEKRVIEYFWRCFDSYREDNFEEYSTVFTQDKENVNIVLDKVSFEMELPNLDNELISICVDIYVDEKKIGWFKQLFLLNGDQYDEYFVIE